MKVVCFVFISVFLGDDRSRTSAKVKIVTSCTISCTPWKRDNLKQEKETSKMAPQSENTVYPKPTRNRTIGAKFREHPYIPMGMLGGLLVTVYGIANYRNHQELTLSGYFMKLRVKAQTVVVGSLAAGLLYKVVRDAYLERKEQREVSQDV